MDPHSSFAHDSATNGYKSMLFGGILVVVLLFIIGGILLMVKNESESKQEMNHTAVPEDIQTSQGKDSENLHVIPMNIDKNRYNERFLL
jgi:cell division protein FtsN